MSENIRVRSVVGRFLGQPHLPPSPTAAHWTVNGWRLYCGSADWMPRNLYERCETAFPINDPAHRSRLRDEILASYLADNVKSRWLDGDGNYHRATKTGPHFNAQDFLIRLTEGGATIADIPAPSLPAVHKPPAKRAVKRS